MALTVNVVRSFVVGDHRETVADVTFDTSYRTGGLAITPAQLNLSNVLFMLPTVATTGQTFSYDATNGRLLAFAGGSQVADATNLSTVTTRIVAHGKYGA